MIEHDKKRNEYYDKIAEKNGFGTNLNDSDQEVKPFIKGVVRKARTAQNLSQYLWAATGVGIGVQEPWAELLELRRVYPGKTFKGFLKTTCRTLYNSTVKSCKEFFNGGREGAINPHAKIVGRTILGLALITTVAGAINAMRNPYIKNTKAMDNSTVFKDNQRVTED